MANFRRFLAKMVKTIKKALGTFSDLSEFYLSEKFEKVMNGFREKAATNARTNEG